MVLTDLIKAFASQHNLPNSFCHTAEKYFIPLVQSIHSQALASDRPVLIGINGCQGSGKSTLTDLLISLLNGPLACSAVGMSIDDFYLTKQERLCLSKDTHPLFITRGVPGTHDVALMESVCGNLVASSLPVLVPSFNKAIDDRRGKEEWTAVEKPVKVILFEGWCVGATAQASADLQSPINELERNEDPDGRWRSYANDKLTSEYKAFFNKLDRLVMLKAPGFYAVESWRIEQEERLRGVLRLKGADQSALMTEEQIKRFIQHYERITTHSLQVLPMLADDLFVLNEERQIIEAHVK